MSISLQQLRSDTPGVQPESLIPGQICFNVADRVMYVGNGTSFKTSFDGTQVPGVVGQGWFTIPLTFNALADYYVVNPEYYNDNPVANQVLTWDGSAGHAIWSDPSAVGGGAYLTTNALVTAAPGLSVSEKITNALEVVPQETNSVIVSGLPGETYQGFYQFISGTWRFAAQNAFPTASQVPLAPIVGLSATTVQAGVAGAYTLANTANNTANTANNTANNAKTTADTALLEANSAQEDATAAQVTANLALTSAQSAELKADDALTAAQSADSKADTAIQVASDAYTLASAALPKSGGTMTGNIVFNNGQLVDAGTY